MDNLMHSRILEADQFWVEEDLGCAVAFLANLGGERMVVLAWNRACVGE